MKRLRPIRNNLDYESALREIEELWDSPPGGPQSDRLEVLAILVHDYEERRFFAKVPEDPVEAILHAMDRHGLSRKDLERILGSRGRVSEILNRKRGLSVGMIRRLHEDLQIPLESLIAIGKDLTKAA